MTVLTREEKKERGQEIDLFNLFPPKGVHNNNNYFI